MNIQEFIKCKDEWQAKIDEFANKILMHRCYSSNVYDWEARDEGDKLIFCTDEYIITVPSFLFTVNDEVLELFMKDRDVELDDIDTAAKKINGKIKRVENKLRYAIQDMYAVKRLKLNDSFLVKKESEVSSVRKELTALENERTKFAEQYKEARYFRAS